MDEADRDMAIRAILAEAGGEGPMGMASVANVIRNRLNAGNFGPNVASIVRAKGQFEPFAGYGKGGDNDPARFKPGSPDYEGAGRIVDAVFAGNSPDPTKGATHFFAPKLQGDLGRKRPAWAQGDGVTIGGHSFYNPDGSGGATPPAPAGGMTPGAPPAPPKPMMASQNEPLDLAKFLSAIQKGGGGQEQTSLLGRLIFGAGGLNGYLDQKLPGGIVGMFGGQGGQNASAANPTFAPSSPASPAGSSFGDIGKLIQQAFGSASKNGGGGATPAPAAFATPSMVAPPAEAAGGDFNAIAQRFGLDNSLS